MSTGDEKQLPGSGKPGQFSRAALQALGGFIPVVGGLISAGAGYWSEQEQQRVNDFIQAWLKMLEDELAEKQQVLGEIIVRLDIHDDEISKRIRSDEYQAILKKAFRNWAGAESQTKREYIRNILSNAAAARLASDEVVTLFIEWLQRYSEFHFTVIADVYRNPGTTRAAIWSRAGSGPVREDSAEADLFKLLIHDLSTGHVIRQHREVDGLGNFRKAPRPTTRGPASPVLTSAFEDGKQYELTALGRQFVHYAMTEVTVKIEQKQTAKSHANATDVTEPENVSGQ